MRILCRSVAGVVEIRMIKPSGIINNNLTFKPGFYRVYQNVPPPTIVSLGRRPGKRGVSYWRENHNLEHILQHGYDRSDTRIFSTRILAALLWLPFISSSPPIQKLNELIYAGDGCLLDTGNFPYSSPVPWELCIIQRVFGWLLWIHIARTRRLKATWLCRAVFKRP